MGNIRSSYILEVSTEKEEATLDMEKRKFSDPAILAAFEALEKPFTITSMRNPDTNMVDWLVEGDDIDVALQEIYSNASVGVLDFIKSLKSFRSSIFALKGGKK